MAAQKFRESAEEALRGHLHDGITIAVGGFGLCGIPADLIEVVRDSGICDLTIISNNMGIDGAGLGLLIENKQVERVVASYVGENKLFASQFLNGTLDVEFVPQGTLAERLRAGGAGIPAFFTKTGVGTPVAKGKPHEEFAGELYVRERGLLADVALVHAHLADRQGNLRYRSTARNFNPLVATAGDITVVQAENILDPGVFIDPDDIMTSGIFVDALVLASDREKQIEQRTVRPRIDEPAQARAKEMVG